VADRSAPAQPRGPPHRSRCFSPAATYDAGLVDIVDGKAALDFELAEQFPFLETGLREGSH
jgi:hypothetical protein